MSSDPLLTSTEIASETRADARATRGGHSEVSVPASDKATAAAAATKKGNKAATFAEILEAAICDFAVLAADDVPVLGKIVSAAKLIHSKVKAMEEMEKFCGKVTIRVAVLLMLLGNTDVRSVIENDPSCRILLDTVYCHIDEARGTIDKHANRGLIARCCGADTALVALKDIHGDLVTTFTMLHQFVTMRRAAMAEDCTDGKPTDVTVGRLVTAINVQGIAMMATITESPVAADVLRDNMRQVAETISMNVKAALEMQTTELKDFIARTAVDTEQKLLSTFTQRAQGDIALHGLVAQQLRRTAEENAISHAATLAAVRDYAKETDCRLQEIATAVAKLAPATKPGDGEEHGEEHGAATGEPSTDSGQDQSQPETPETGSNETGHQHGEEHGEEDGAATGEPSTGSDQDQSQPAAPPPAAAGPALSDADRFEALVALLERRGVSRSEMSKHLGYAGKSGPRDLGAVRDGRSGKCSAGDAVAELKRVYNQKLAAV